MRKPKIFTQEVLDRIPVMVEDGMKLQEIADKIGCTKGSLKVTCSNRGISLRRPGRPKHQRPIAVLLPKIKINQQTLDGLHQHAAKSGHTEVQLASKLLQVIVQDNLYDALLDKEEA